ncbi:trimeric intracellular cation channel family protein [Altericroceibacterium spongiae]|uniref:Trimeric intracellular cation channel family protein n=1 Tax=Altericroceibacterium spongiae TaxID=2320269 RepID=A0A420EMR7_9SPHN|nr:trimeric intracellular cation channel family protein [Altericroceibacterium spongiae]RKF21896.1 trimeric intracellular cation channel family protein [Altericroceibacterium spongiae]
MAVPVTPLVLPQSLDLLGTAIFALTGALLAARLRQDFVTMAFFALMTGVGGGTLRDLMIGAPVFWVRDPWVAPLCFGMAVLVWVTPRQRWENELLLWADAAGLAAFAVLGAAKALGWGVAPVPAILMGILTGSAGGIIRDVVAGVPSILMRRELYITPAAVAAGLCALGMSFHLANEATWIIAALGGFAIRAAALYWNLRLPTYAHADKEG